MTQKTTSPTEDDESSPERPNVEKLAYSPSELLAAAPIGHTALYQELNSGRLPARKLGKSTVILAGDAKAWLTNLPHYDPAQAAKLSPQGKRRGKAAADGGGAS